jgi:hypothetical protein
MTQKKTEEIINNLLDEISSLKALIEQLKSEIHTANLERFRHD